MCDRLAGNWLRSCLLFSRSGQPGVMPAILARPSNQGAAAGRIHLLRSELRALSADAGPAPSHGLNITHSATARCPTRERSPRGPRGGGTGADTNVAQRLERCPLSEYLHQTEKTERTVASDDIATNRSGIIIFKSSIDLYVPAFVTLR